MKIQIVLALCVFAALAVLVLADVGGSADDFIRVDFRPENCDRKSKNGDKLKMHYTGTLPDGAKFDSSRDRGQPFSFTLGAGQVIQGWEKGLQGMCIGEKRTLRIPPEDGYGARGYPPIIPANSMLIFDVELIDFA